MQANPFDDGWSGSGRNAVTVPSSTVAISPHDASQMPQKVFFS